MAKSPPRLRAAQSESAAGGSRRRGLLADRFAACPSGISFSNDGHTQEGRRNAGDGQARARVLAVEQRLQLGLELVCAVASLRRGEGVHGWPVIGAELAKEARRWAGIVEG
jgi:hypothetical protein